MNLREKYGIPPNAIITIAGTVGVGKSTMTKALADALRFKTSFENVDTNPYLDRFYEDFSKWSFHLQIYFLAERFKEQKRMFEYGGGGGDISIKPGVEGRTLAIVSSTLNPGNCPPSPGFAPWATLICNSEELFK